jgi:hypothetical protein
MGEAHSVLTTAILLPQRLSSYGGKMCHCACSPILGSVCLSVHWATEIHRPKSTVWPIPVYYGCEKMWTIREEEMDSIASYIRGARGSVVVEALWYKPEGRGFESQWGDWISSIYVMFPAALGPGVYSTSNINEFQKQKKMNICCAV